jgi:hypothetical protein
MKAISTLLFLALIATTGGLAVLLIPETGRTEKFWLSIGAIGLSEFFLWVAFTFRGTRRGEQAGGMAKLSLITATTIYFFATCALAFAAPTALPFKMLLALHLVVLLGFVFMAGLSAIGTRALQGTREATRPR